MAEPPYRPEGTYFLLTTIVRVGGVKPFSLQATGNDGTLTGDQLLLNVFKLVVLPMKVLWVEGVQFSRS